MAALWLVLVVLAMLSVAEALAIAALAREIGLLSRRLPPAPALMDSAKPEIGLPLPAVTVAASKGSDRLGLSGPAELPRVLIFLSTNCSSCTRLVQELPGLFTDWPDYIFYPIVSADRSEQVAAIRRQTGYSGPLYLDDQGAMKALQLLSTPRAIVVDKDGKVAATGVVNTREMVTSLISGHVREMPDAVWMDAHELGVRS